jgi:hypothetical protein
VEPGLCVAAGGPAGPGGPLPATGGSVAGVAILLLVAALALRWLGGRVVVALGVVAAVLALAAPPAPVASAAAGSGCVIAGADASNITPFTPSHPAASSLDPLGDAAAANPDGMPGGLWDQIAGPIGLTSDAQVTVSGMWGEPFVDANGNHRHDAAEDFTDDLVNSAIDPTSVRKYDGIYLGGFGNDRIARAPFDPIWVRTVYIADPAGGPSIALVSIDVIGYFGDRVPLVVARARALDPAFDAGQVIVAHTHDHSSIDMIGLWGPLAPGEAVPTDGTYPKYERYVEEKMARSLVAAFQARRPARFRAGAIDASEHFVTRRSNVEQLAGLTSRNSCRTPWFFDDELRAFQLEDVDGRTVATAVNWAMHVESMEDGNQYLSSDNPHAARAELEAAFGGVAIYTNGAQGAVEVVGDSCTRRWQRDTFDGERFPVDDGGRPLALRQANDVNVAPLEARDRSYAIGRVIGAAAAAALRRAPWEPDPAMEVLAQDVYFPTNNGGLLALTAAGTIDKPSYTGVEHAPVSAAELTALIGSGATPPSGIDVKSTLFAWRIGSTSFVTAPGEVFPELYYGVATRSRATGVGDYVNPNPAALACAARPFAYSGDPDVAGAHTGRPYEPSIRAAQERRFQSTTNFIIGYAPDLLGYIVPGYDFSWYVAPAAGGVGLGALIGEAPDPCAASVPDLAFPGVTYRDHYHETNSASSVLASGIACSILDLLVGRASTEADASCEEFRAFRTAGIAHVGLGPILFRPNDGAPVGHY